MQPTRASLWLRPQASSAGGGGTAAPGGGPSG
jgi:hypothetical protein